MRRFLFLLMISGVMIAGAGCGGSSNPLTLVITTSPGTISGGSTFSFTATTTNATSESGATFALTLNTPSSTTDDTTPCTAACGSIINTGTEVTSTIVSGGTTYYDLSTTATYDAPLEAPTPNEIILTATAASNSAITADVQFGIGTPAITVRLANTFTSIAPGAPSQTVTAVVSFDSANAGVTWTLDAGGAACAPACGTLTPAAAPSFAATYTPPPTLPAAPNNTPTITATSVTDTTKSAFDAFSIQSPSLPISVTITNPFTQITAGAAPVTIDAHVTNDQDNQGVTWSILPTAGTGGLGAATATSIQYTAPNQAPEPPDNTPTITATSVADPTKFDSFTFTIEPAAATNAAVQSACDANGSYVFRIAGTDSVGKPIAMVGSMTVESGNVAVTSLDVNDNFQIASSGGISGTCTTVTSADGSSFGVITFSSPLPSLGAQPALRLEGPQSEMTFTVDKANVTIEIDSQDPSTFAQFGGGFAYLLNDESAPARTASAGRFTLSFDGAKGTIANGLMDASATGSGALVSNGSLTGTATPPDANGRGTMNLNFAGRGSRAFVYYAVSAGQFVLAEMDPTARPQADAVAPVGFGPSLASGDAIGQSLASLSSAAIEPIGGIINGELASFNPSSGRATFEINDGNPAPVVVYVSASGQGRFLDTSTGPSTRGLAGPIRFPIAESTQR